MLVIDILCVRLITAVGNLLITHQSAVCLAGTFPLYVNVTRGYRMFVFRKIEGRHCIDTDRTVCERLCGGSLEWRIDDLHYGSDVVALMTGIFIFCVWRRCKSATYQWYLSSCQLYISFFVLMCTPYFREGYDPEIVNVSCTRGPVLHVCIPCSVLRIGSVHVKDTTLSVLGE